MVLTKIFTKLAFCFQRTASRCLYKNEVALETGTKSRICPELISKAKVTAGTSTSLTADTP